MPGDERIRDAESGQVLVVGSDAVGVRVARALPAETTFAGLDEGVVERVGDSVTEAVVVDSQRFTVPDGGADTAIVATSVDSLNLLYAQRLRLSDGISRVIARVNDPQYHETFSAIGAETVCGTTALSDTLRESYTDSLSHNG